MQYINRISALEDDKVYQLNGEGIVSVNGTLLYKDITDIHLKYAPSRYYTNIYRCEIKTETQTITLSNRKYVKLATFEYQCAQYNDFIKSLHTNVGNGSAKLLAGMKPLRFWLEMPFALVFFAAMLTLLFLFGGVLIGGVFALVLLIRLIPYYIKNLPRSYFPSSIPSNILPKP